MQFRILGPLEVEDDGERVAIRGAKQRALLGLLLLRANEVVSRDALIDGLWGEHPPHASDHSLVAHVSRLRKLLRDKQGLVSTTAGGYALRLDGSELDLAEFQRLADDGRAALRAGDEDRAAEMLRRAMSLWRGSALEDVDLDSSAAIEILELEERRLAAHEDLIEAEVARGRHAEVLPELERLARLNPFRERLHGHLMLALYRCGRQADALQLYHRFHHRLVDELGIEPTRELRELQKAVLRQEEQLEPSTPSRPSATGGRTRAPRRRVVIGAFGAAAALLGGAAALLALKVTSQAPVHVGGNAIGIIASKTSALADQVPIGAVPGEVAVGEGAVWVTNADAGTVSRIDPVTLRRVQTITVGGGPNGIAVAKGAVWVANSLDGTVSRIDPVTNTVVQTIPVGNGPTGVAFGAGAVWVANATDRTIDRIDPLSGRVERTIDVAANELAYGAGALWATSTSDNSVSRIDPRSNTNVQTIPVGNEPAGITFGNDSTWVANKVDGTVSRIDPTTNSIAATIPVGGDPSEIAVGAGGAWVSDESGSATRIDPQTDRVEAQVEIGNRPSGIAVDQTRGRVLIGVRASGPAHRGGTLMLNANVISSIDTAVAYDVNEWSVLSITGDGLVGFDRTGGSEGTQLVPDLATSIPTPTNLGRTYTFQLRPNIRYSSGRLVKASDVRNALARDFRFGTLSPAASFYGGIVGGSACAKAPKRCNLSKGVIVNDAARSIIFHLRAPDPEFLYKLALPFAYAVPPGTPAHDVGTHPLPATGPYVIAAYRPKHFLSLYRNTRFREWSKAAQPDGYPDEIVVRIGEPAEKALAAVERGQSDAFDSWGPGSPSAARLHELRTLFASQLHTNPRPVTVGFFFNTHLPPFDDVNARRAVNYAADRALAISRLGGPDTGRPTCQVLPPHFPGYVPYCPYSARSTGTRSWEAPDPGEGRRLIAASGARGARVKVWFSQWARPWFTTLGPYMVKLLDSLGYHASATMESPRTDIRTEQVGFVAWAPDYPSAWDFFAPLSCGSWSQFCDASIDRQRTRARDLEATNPQSANRLWARIDRRLVAEAAWVPLVTPKWVDFLSRRVGNYQYNPEWGMLIDQLWVR